MPYPYMLVTHFSGWLDTDDFLILVPLSGEHAAYDIGAHRSGQSLINNHSHLVALG
jgi:hypothetical protein